MEQARATFLTTYMNWAKPSLLALLVGVLTTIFSLIGAASNAVPVILKTLNLPECPSPNRPRRRASRPRATRRECATGSPSRRRPP